MSTYLLKTNIVSINTINYIISFSNFKINSSTAYTTLYDFIFEIEKGFNNNTEIKFLAENYDSVIKIIPFYQQGYSFVNDFDSKSNNFVYIGYSFIGIAGMLAITSFLMTYSIINTHE